MIRRSATAFFAALILLLARDASACGICFYEDLQPWFPPVVVWSYLTVVAWPVVFCFTRAGGGGVVGFAAAMAATAAAIALAIVELGPIPFAVLMGLSALRLAAAWRRGPNETVRRLTWALVVAYGVSAVWVTVALWRFL